jgi:hypothetical protein
MRGGPKSKIEGTRYVTMDDVATGMPETCVNHKQRGEERIWPTRHPYSPRVPPIESTVIPYSSPQIWPTRHPYSPRVPESRKTKAGSPTRNNVGSRPSSSRFRSRPVFLSSPILPDPSRRRRRLRVPPRAAPASRLPHWSST